MAAKKAYKRLPQSPSSRDNVYRISKTSKKCSRTVQSLGAQRLHASSPSADNFAQAALLKGLLQTKRKIVVVSGAGISVNAGGKCFFASLAHSTDDIVPDFRTMRKSSRSSFDISAYDSNSATARFHTMICDIARLSNGAMPTLFHYFMDQLAQDGRLLRHYTQNIDCIERHLHHLREQTIQLHGRINQVKCQSCSWTGPFVPEAFIGSQLSDCPRCQQVALERERNGKRHLGIGRVRPDIVLYGEENPNAGLIGETSQCDLQTGPDVVFVVGTDLRVPGAQRLAKELCRTVKSDGGLTIWVNNNLPLCQLGIDFDFVFQGDCDELVAGFLG